MLDPIVEEVERQRVGFVDEFLGARDATERGVDVAVEPVLSLLSLDLHAARYRPGARPKGRKHLGLEREWNHGIVLA